MIDPPKIFISYAHKDRKLFEELNTQLAPLIRSDHVSAWHDGQIQPGADWDDAIKNALAAADIAVLLVTPNFLASNYIFNNELPELLKKKHLLWIAASASNYQVTSLGKLQSANDPARPLDSFPKSRRNAEWVAICNKILAVTASSNPPAPPTTSPTASNHGDKVSRLDLTRKLSSLPASAIDILVASVPDASRYDTPNLPIPTRVAKLIEYVESGLGPGLQALVDAIRTHFPTLFPL